jgi:hypothetical protein
MYRWTTVSQYIDTHTLTQSVHQYIDTHTLTQSVRQYIDTNTLTESVDRMSINVLGRTVLVCMYQCTG